MQKKLLQKGQFKKTVEETGDLIRNKIPDKTTKASKNNLEETENEADIPKERYISPEKGRKLLMN